MTEMMIASPAALDGAVTDGTVRINMSLRDERGFVSYYEDLDVDIRTAREVLALLSRGTAAIRDRAKR